MPKPDLREIPQVDQVTIREQYLVDYLTEEFGGEHGKRVDLRIRVIEEDNERGVIVRSPSREYFFPFSWALSAELFKEVRAQIQQIRSLYY